MICLLYTSKCSQKAVQQVLFMVLFRQVRWLPLTLHLLSLIHISQLKKDEAQAQKAKRDLERIRPLYEQTAASQLDLDNATAAYETAEASVAMSLSLIHIFIIQQQFIEHV